MGVGTYVVVAIVLILLVLFFKRMFMKKHDLTKGEVSAQKETSIDAIALEQSKNADTNFCYSVWIYVNDWNYRYGENKIIFIRGTDDKPCPKVELDKTQNNLNVTMAIHPGSNSGPKLGDVLDKVSHKVSGSDAHQTQTHSCTVNNIPIQKWVNILVTGRGRTVDIYLDGKLVRTCLLPGVPVINSGSPVKLTPDGGFAGETNRFQFWPEACSPQKAWDIYAAGKGGGGPLDAIGKIKVKMSLTDGGKVMDSVSI
jgi:hypothetical protein